MSAQQNRFSSLVKENKPSKGQPETKQNPQTENRSSKPHQEAKPNRFNFTESELQKKDQNTREDFGNRERPNNFRDRIQFERDRRAKDEAAAAERKKLELERSLTDAASFPELVACQQKLTTQSETHVPNFLEKVKWIEDDKPIPWDDGLTILGADDKNPPRKQRRPKTPYEIMSKQVELYETWKANYIAQYGEYYYERYYRFPNYDYEYFDKLDEKYEAELEELERLEQEKERDQYIEYNTHYDHKKQYDE
jgi:hypothetical protein